MTPRVARRPVRPAAGGARAAAAGGIPARVRGALWGVLLALAAPACRDPGRVDDAALAPVARVNVTPPVA